MRSFRGFQFRNHFRLLQVDIESANKWSLLTIRSVSEALQRHLKRWIQGVAIRTVDGIDCEIWVIFKILLRCQGVVIADTSDLVMNMRRSVSLTWSELVPAWQNCVELEIAFAVRHEFSTTSIIQTMRMIWIVALRIRRPNVQLWFDSSHAVLLTNTSNHFQMGAVFSRIVVANLLIPALRRTRLVIRTLGCRFSE